MRHLAVAAVVVAGVPKPSLLEARGRCLRSLVLTLPGQTTTRLVVERDDSALVQDARIVASTLRESGGSEEMSYVWLRAHEDPLLWMADAVAWCWAAGGQWRDLVSPFVTVLKV